MIRTHRLLHLVTAAVTIPLVASLLPAQGKTDLLSAGAAAPDFVSVGLDGKEVRLSDHLGKVVVLDFWATWCGPCKAAMPHVQEVAAAHRQDGVVTLAVCTSDTRAKFEAWVRDNGAKFPDVTFTCDPHEQGADDYDERAANRLYHVGGLPTKFVIGRDGKIAAAIVGFEDGDLRLEGALARAGVAIDAAVAKKGEEQLVQAAKEQAAQAAAAAKRPPFFPAFGSINAGEPLPEVTFLGEDGKEFQLSSLRGKPVVLAFAWAEIMPRRELQALAEEYAACGVQVVAAFVGTSQEELAAWCARNAADCDFRIALDPAGKYVPASEQATFEERMAFEAKTVLANFWKGNMRPGMPAVIAADAEGRLLGGFGLANRKEGLGNLLAHAGVKLPPELMPTKAWPPESFEAPKPRAPEAPVTPIAIGSAAPDFVMQDVEGKDVKLSSYRGKVVVLDFWATWCGPCKAALPHVQELAKHYADQDVVVIASCTSDARDEFVDWVQVHGGKYPDVLFAHDAAERKPERASRALYGVGGIPHQFVIDREGKVVAQVVGYQAGEVLLDAALAKAGVKVDAAVLEKAAADQRKRDESKPASSMKAAPMVPLGGGK